MLEISCTGPILVCYIQNFKLNMNVTGSHLKDGFSHNVAQIVQHAAVNIVRLWLTLAMVKRNCTPDNDNLYYIRGGG